MALKNGPNSLLWKIFILWVLADLSLSFLPLSLTLKIALGFLFLAVPFVYLVKSAPLPDSVFQKVFQAEFLPDPSGKILSAVFLLGILLRLWGLTSLSVWPTSDEGWMSSISLDLSRHWQWNLLFSSSQVPPAHFWGESLLFRLFGPSLSTLWLFPALVSILNLGLCYWAARSFFPPRFSFFCLLLGILNYWFLWSGRLCVLTADAVLPFELLALGFFGRALASKTAGSRRWNTVLWGITGGLCLYGAIEGAVLAAAMALTALGRGVLNPKERKNLGLGFAAGLAVAAPLVFYGLSHHYGSYVSSLFVTKDSGYYENRWMAPLSHFTALFWGARDWIFGGGILNPFETALVFLGIAYCLKDQRPLCRWLPAAFLFFLLPGFLTNNFDPFRVVPVAPLLLVFIALGWGWLWSGIPARARSSTGGPATLGLLVLCALWNLYHLAGPYHQAWGRQGPFTSRLKDIELWRAFDWLDQTRQTQGPGLILQDFPINTDQSLRVAVYPFNAKDNPGLSAVPVRWAAFLSNAQYTPFLQRRFPDARWVWLSDHLPLTYGGLELGILPLSGGNQVCLGRWAKADSDLEEVNRILTQFPIRDSEGLALQTLQSHRADFEGDAFLESVFWDKMQSLDTKRGDWASAVEALRQAVQKGYPIPYFYQWMAEYLKEGHQDQAAEEAYQKALRLSAQSSH